MEEDIFEFENTKELLLTVKLISGETISVVGNQVIDMPEIISHRIEIKEDIVVFGCMGIKRDLIIKAKNDNYSFQILEEYYFNKYKKYMLKNFYISNGLADEEDILQ